MNTIWVFGCSFSQGAGAYFPGWLKIATDNRYTVNSTYIEALNTYRWTKRLIDKLTAKTKNRYLLKDFSRGGSGIKYSLQSFLVNINRIKEGDIVVVGLTQANREDIILEGVKPYYEEINVKTLQPTFVDSVLNNSYSGYFINKQSSEERDWIDDFGRDGLETLCKGYMVKTGMHSGKTSKSTLKVEEEIAYEIYKNTFEVLRKIGIKGYIWDTTLWNTMVDGTECKQWINPGEYKCEQVFESLYTWSNSNFHDFHWSLNGEAYFGEFLYWCMENGYTAISSNIINKFIQEKPKCELPYVHYKDLVEIQETL